MAWNEPGDGDKDPWNRKPDEADELDESIRKFKEKFSGIFGSGGSANGDGGSLLTMGLIGGVLILLWALSGIFIVQPAERAVILHFGKYARTEGPGPHWIPRFIDSRYIVNVQKIQSYSYPANMLTRDENIVSVNVAVPYRVDDPQAYLFNVVNPEVSLQQATASALRQVVGKTDLETALTNGREQVRQRVQKQLTKLLKQYGTGLMITDLALQSVKAPEPVKPAFDDAINAQEDEKRFKENAERDAQITVQKANGQARRIITEAAAYKQRVILNAKANIATYLALLPQVRHAPRVTRDRLYLDTMESVLAHSTKLLVDTKGSNNMFYLPLDKIMSQQTAKVVPAQHFTPRSPTRMTNYSSTNHQSRDFTERPDRSRIIDG